MHDGFVQIAERALPDFSGRGIVLRHRVTNAEIVVVQNTDPEPVFTLSLRTRPTRNDGIAHVLEHLIFRGSRRFPQTNLYSSLMQGTGVTGLNASTKADHTMFHFSTADQDDFATLTEVMLDAAFDPLLREADIAQERGIVMNEMAGHHADPANRITEGLRQRMFPGSVYAVDFGGTPAEISTLTPERLHDFHARHCHPGNAQVFLWGKLDLPSRLDQLDILLQSYPSRAADQVPPLPSPARMQDDTGTYPGKTDGPQYIGLGWTCDAGHDDLWEAASLHLLDHPDGLLRQRLQSQGYHLLGKGFTRDMPQSTFEIALAGPRPISAHWVLSEIEKALIALPTGWEHEAISRFALHLSRLGNGRPGPAGLRALGLLADGWRQGADPLALLDIGARITALTKALVVTSEPMIGRIRHALIDTPHRASLLLTPKAVTTDQTALPDAQRQMPDPTRKTPSFLPLRTGPVPPTRNTDIETEDINGTLFVQVPGPPLARAELALSLSGFATDDIKSLPVLLAVLRQLPLFPNLSLNCWSDGYSDAPLYLSISGVALPADAQNLLRALDVPLHHSLPDPDRLHPTLRQARAAVVSHIAGFGHTHCDIRLRTAGGQSGVMDEWVNGISQIEAFDTALTQSPEALWHRLSTVQDMLAHRSRATLAISGIDPTLAGVRPEASVPVPQDGQTPQFPRSEAIVTQTANFTAGQSLTLSDPGAARIAAHMLEFGWLWDAVRVAGGAYSVRAAFDPGDCLLRLVSIRDPSPLNTLDQFGKSPLWLSRHARGELLDRCRSATLGLLLRPVRPEEVLTTALRRYLSGETAITRQKRLDQVKSVGSIEMRRLADEFDAGLSDARTVILGPEAGVTTVVSSLDGMVIRR